MFVINPQIEIKFIKVRNTEKEKTSNNVYGYLFEKNYTKKLISTMLKFCLRKCYK